MSLFLEEYFEFFLSITRMLHPPPKDEPLRLRQNISPSPLQWRRTLRVQSIEMPVVLLKRFFPPEQCPFGHIKSISRCLCAMLTPEPQYLHSPIHLLFVPHRPQSYRPFPHTQPASSTSKPVENPHVSSIMRSAKCI